MKLTKSANAGSKAQRALTPLEVQALKHDHKRGISERDLAKKYGLSLSSVSYIINGKTYAS